MTDEEPPVSTPLVASVVLSYNNFADTDECLESLAAQAYPRHEIIIVDNHSIDGSYERLTEKWSQRSRIIACPTNLGVAEGYNAGVREALLRAAEFVVVCNNDIVVEPNFVEVLLGVFERDERIGMASPVTVYYGEPDRIWFAGIILDDRFGITRNVLRGQPAGRLDPARRVWDSDYVLTHATMLSRPALERAGKLDHRFFYGYDDVDYSLRLRRLHYRCVAVSGTIVKHKVSVTAGTNGSSLLRPAPAFTYGTGTVLLGAKHYSGRRAPLFLLGLAARAAFTTAQMIRAGGWRTAGSYSRGLAVGLLRHGPALLTGSETRRPREGF